MTAIRTFRTERLLLRPPRPDDLESLVALGADPDVMRYIGTGQTQSRDEAQRWLKSMLAGARSGAAGAEDLPGWLVITTPDAAHWIGLAALRHLDPRHATVLNGDFVEVGYRLARAQWGQGYATEAAAALVRHGFETLELPMITAIAHVDNAASNRVIQKVGLHYQKTYRLGEIRINFHAAEREAWNHSQR